MEYIYPKLIEIVDFVDVYYSYFLSQDEEGKYIGPLDIQVYAHQPDKAKRINGVEFLDIIEPCYAGLCTWAYIKKLSTMPSNLTLFCDEVSFKPSNAWQDLHRLKNFSIIPNGDKCNVFISVADIFTESINEILRMKNAKLNQKIKFLLPGLQDKVETTYMGSSWLYGIKPTHDLQVDHSAKMAHPLFVLFPSTFKFYGSSNKKLFENSTLVALVQDTAVRKNGSVKFFDPDRDPKILTEHDYLVYHDQNSKEVVDNLVNLHIPSKPIKSTDLKQL